MTEPRRRRSSTLLPMPVRWTLARARSLLGTKFALVASLVAFVGAAWLVELIAGRQDPVELWQPLALAVAAIPVALWLAFFHIHERATVEPKGPVAALAVAGAMIAAPLAEFVTAIGAPPVALAQDGMALSIDRMVHAVLVVGLSQELCKYAVVRYSVYNSPRFDEPMDGVVYMMSVGAGFALWENYHRLSSQGLRVYLSTGAAEAAVTTLAHASFAGALGYVMGRARFTRRSPMVRGVLLLVGLLGAAGLNGVFSLAQAYIDESYPTARWAKVGVAAAWAATVFATLLLASRRLVMAPTRKEEAP